MNVYLAAPIHRRAEMASIAAELRALGMDVVSRWVDEVEPVEAELVAESAAVFAQRDMDDLADADTFVVFTEPSGSEFEHRSGSHVETGIALAWGLRVLVVGHRRNVFHDLPQVEHFASWREARAAVLLHQVCGQPRGARMTCRWCGHVAGDPVSLVVHEARCWREGMAAHDARGEG